MPKGMLSACFPPGIYLLGCGFLVLCLQFFFALFIGEADDVVTYVAITLAGYLTRTLLKEPETLFYFEAYIW
jgi:hypothetical protein